MSLNAEDMISLYRRWPNSLYNGYTASSNLDVDVKEPVYVCGMGGSGVVGEYAAALLRDRIAIHVYKSHELPAVRDGTLISISYSGETYETIRCAMIALGRGVRLLAVAREGSTLYRIASERGEGAVSVTPGILPRTALAEMLGATLGLILGPEAGDAVRRASELMESRYDPAIAQELAEHLVGGIPVIGSCGVYGIVARRWATELNENAKLPVIVEEYPEAAHNSIVGWEKPTSCGFRFLVIKGYHGDDRLCPLIYRLISDIYGGVGIVKELDVSNVAEENTVAGFLLPTMYAGEASVWAAVKRGVSPSATLNIQRYKREVVSNIG